MTKHKCLSGFTTIPYAARVSHPMQSAMFTSSDDQKSRQSMLSHATDHDTFYTIFHCEFTMPDFPIQIYKTSLWLSNHKRKSESTSDARLSSTPFTTNVNC
ncbi:predicted protein [Coccidioides posadasii str. Silveira]|uniref:Predicted protein n=1 Tax=Coccidioides posadasii (strain RMSCC 757 / Silveira) TaxID=443226 RepID=E9DD42_COCPS|nr:predicted protein [Coccidioides posadasii str. Silveira]